MGQPDQSQQERPAAGNKEAELARLRGPTPETGSPDDAGCREHLDRTPPRLIEATGIEADVRAHRSDVVQPTAVQLERAGRALEQVLELAALLPTEHKSELRLPRLDAYDGGTS